MLCCAVQWLPEKIHFVQRLYYSRPAKITDEYVMKIYSNEIYQNQGSFNKYINFIHTLQYVSTSTLIEEIQ